MERIRDAYCSNPTLLELGGLGVPFTAQKLRHPKLVWINHRWLLQNRIKVDDQQAVDSAVRWIEEHLGFAVPQSHDQPAEYIEAFKTFKADRYGGSGIGPHGGSGRCGTWDGFQVKGIGVTPLVGSGLGYEHSHGAVTLEEAIREATYSELLCQEAPFGAVPVIAIIATGTRMHWGEPRALLIRPPFMRASHLERAPFFRPVSARLNAERDYSNDVARVIRTVQMVSSKDRQEDLLVRVKDLHEFIDRSTRQLAFSHVHRLYFGACSTSNLTINGEILDFGSARALVNWSSVECMHGAPRFGRDDLELLLSGCREIEFYIKKYAPNSAFLDKRADLELHLRESYEAHLLRSFHEVSGGECTADRDNGSHLAGIIASYFNRQQDGLKLSFLTGHSPNEQRSLYEEICERQELVGDGVQKECFKHASRRSSCALPGHHEFSDVRLHHMRRMLMPRNELFREVLQQKIYKEIIDALAPSDPNFRHRTSEFIRNSVSRARRIFRWFSAEWIIMGSASNSYSTVLVAQHRSSGKSLALLHGHVLEGRLYFHGQALALERDRPDGTLWFSVILPDSYSGAAIELPVFGQACVIPAADVFYG